MSSHLSPWQERFLQSAYGDRPYELVSFALPKGVSLQTFLREMHQ